MFGMDEEFPTAPPEPTAEELKTQKADEAKAAFTQRQLEWESQQREWAAEQAAADEVYEEFDQYAGGGAYGSCPSPGLHGKSGFKDLQTKATTKAKGGDKEAKPYKATAGGKKPSSEEGKGSTKRVEKKDEAGLKRADSASSDGGQKVELQRPGTKAVQQAMEAALLERQGSAAKPRLSLVTVGHVDAGKSTLMGHLLFEIGEVSQKVMHKYEKLSREAGKASFSYAWVMDEQEEERSRGVTIDVGMKAFETPTKSVTLLDAPGHRDFIPNMISGAAQADVAVLVVDSAEGGFESGFDSGGQTKEHAQLLYSLGIKQVVVAVNKLDMVAWSEARFKEIQGKVQEFMIKQGFREKALRYVPVSGLSGENLLKRSEEQLTAWYKGPTLFEAIDTFKEPSREMESPLRLCVTDVYKSDSLGNSFAGKIEAGAISKGDRVRLAPTSQVVTVKGLEIEGVPVKWAFAGDNVDVGFTGAELNAIGLGFVACDPANPVTAAKRFEAQVVVLDIQRPLLKGSPLVFHSQSAETAASFSKLISLVDAKGEPSGKKPRCLTAGVTANVEIKIDKSFPIEDYASCKPLGRFMLREGGHTVALGVVTAVKGKHK